MNKTCYLQTDSRWASLGYPRSPWVLRNCGCGEVAICNCLIEMEKYAKYTPKTIQPYCKQYAAPNGDGTYWSGIPAMMKHYGLTEVKEHATMGSLWKELAKGDRVAVYLMGARPGGSKRVHWTSGGHYVASVDYKMSGSKHMVYMKDSYSTSSLRNGWISYEENIKGDCVKVWSGKLAGEHAPTPAPVPAGKLDVDGIGGHDTIVATQKFFQVKQDGVISGQVKGQSIYYPSITAVTFGKGGSATVKALQKWCGVTQDGIIGKGTTCAWQKKLRDLGYFKKDETIDGYFGVKSMSAWQRFLNDHLK